MKFTLKWLKTFLDTNCSIAEITDKLISIGFEVEEIIDRSTDLSPFQVAEIIHTEQHPSADKLRVCKVLTRDGEKQIVCGAPNARAGIKVVLATVGTIIPNGKFAIKEAEIRGIKSSGMLCSFEELLISGDSEGIIELPQEALIGEEVLKYFGLDDVVVEISVTPNRGDMLGIYGIARDLAASGIGRLIPPALSGNQDIKFQTCSNAHTAEYSSLFVFREISGLQNIESPLWLKHYLQNIGVNPISAIVDITNYMCYSYGRPMHAYDKAKLSGNLKITLGKNEEKFHALSDKEYNLSDQDIVVRDDIFVRALAGIIGSMDSACSQDTTSIVLESALFDKNHIMSTARRLGIDTDAKYRFERYTDPMMVIPATEIATKMILDICGGVLENTNIYGKEPRAINLHSPIELHTTDIEKLLGVAISIDKASKILNNLGFEVKAEGKDKLIATAPSWRYDISIKEDLIEEIVRIYGFENIPSAEIASTVNFRLMKPLQSRSIMAKRMMAAMGLNELVTFSFMHSSAAANFVEIKDNLTLKNPISSELDYMRPSVIPNLLDSISKNQSRSINDIAVFEVGPVFTGDNIEDEKIVCGGAIYGNIEDNVQVGSRAADIFDVKAIFESLLAEFGFSMEKMQLITTDLPSYLHPNRSALVMLGKNCLGWFGEIHPSLLQKYNLSKRVTSFELNLSSIPETRLKYGKKEDLTVSDYQPVTRDFAFVTDIDTQIGAILTFIANIDKKLIRKVHLFDIYTGDKIEPNKKSVALTVTLQADDRTLAEEELITLHSNIISKVSEKFNCILRS